MGDQMILYFTEGDEELQDWAEKVGDEVFGSNSQLLRKALSHYREQKGEELLDLAEDEPESLV